MTLVKASRPALAASARSCVLPVFFAAALSIATASRRARLLLFKTAFTCRPMNKDVEKVQVYKYTKIQNYEA